METSTEPMTVEECWEHLGERGVGRIGFDAGRGPRIHPIDYTCDGAEVRLRTSATSELARFTQIFAAGGLVTFEIDQVDPAQGERWSVLLEASVASAGDLAPDDPTRWPEPARAVQQSWWIRLVPRQVTGRRLVPASP